ncbi:hypothetical protein [Kribbella shirazensis]|uniref:Uncharacterized protein n=1 Tax=Kribbella shirazensis TaxID=1105143 RepID=A0A7X5ZYF9_9ACTN|nr:hypothetical protein [Kribbella shirazensis]NIK55056.1 hypothetical protein [Kribbella shirazensis]
MKVTSYRELMDQQARAAVRISGAHHSSWDGQLAETDPKRDVNGVARWDHTIEYNRARVVEPLEEMFQNARHYSQDPKTLQSYREALKTVLHENTHMLAGEGTQHAQAQQAFANKPGVKQVEESFTELYSQQQLNAYIDDLGLEEIAPGIKQADAAMAYKRYVPAAETLANSIARNSQGGLTSDEVVRRMAIVTADQKFRAAAEMIYDNSDLPGLMPPEQRAEAVRRIEAAMGPEFAKLENVKSSDDAIRRRQSAVIGGRTATAAYDVVEDLRQQWGMPGPEQQVRRGVGADRETTQANEQANGNGAHQGVDDPGQLSGPEEPARPDLPPELAAAARVGLGNSAPLQSATRLAADQQGSRRTTATGPAQQRQGPETQR